MPASPTQRTLAKLRLDGYIAQVVEKWNPHAKIRQDLFGIIDVLAIADGEVLGVQATAYPNGGARVKKIAESEHIDAIRKANIRVEVWEWRKQKNRYHCKITDCS